MLIEGELLKLPEDVKITGCVSDNASNMVATGKKFMFYHLGCIIHSTQLVIRDAFVDSGSAELKEKVRALLATQADIDVLE